MKLSKKEIVVLGKAYDALKHSFIVLNKDFQIIYLNSYSKKLFGFTEQEIKISSSFNDLLEKHGHPPLFSDKDNLILNQDPMKIKKHKKKWELLRGKVDKKPSIFLFDKDVTEQEEMYDVLTRSVNEVTGQVFSKRLSAQEYMDEIRGCLENVIRQMPCYVYWKDKEFRYIFCNDITADIMGLPSAKHAIGKTDYDFGWDTTLVDSYRATDKKILATGKPILNLEEELIDKNGRVYHTLVNKMPLKNHLGEIIGLLGITVDVTSVKKAEIAKANFIANMSHDIRTPLTGIIGMAQLLEDKVTSEEEKQFAGWIYESGQQLLKLLNGVLDLVSAEEGKEEDLHKDTFNIRQSIEDIIFLEKPTLFHKNLECHLIIDKEVPINIKSDRFKLSRIILNLVGNAIKFTENGSITIRVRIASDNPKMLEFCIADTGKGIPKALLPKIFERFYRVSPSYKGDYIGHGLGLHIVEKFIDLLGGSISVSSDENVGTEFTFTIPLIEAHDLKEKSDKDFVLSIQHEQKSASSTSSNSDSDSNLETDYNLLIVEDNDIALRITENLCLQQGCKVTKAVDGETALQLAKEKKFNLILTDIGLPGMSGNELTKAIRQWEKENNFIAMPIIGLTAHASREAKNESIKAGMNDLYAKPLQTGLLQNILNKYPRTPKESTSLFNNNHDLPETEEDLFMLEQFPLLDAEMGINNLGNEVILKDILVSMVDSELPKELEKLKSAYSNKDWAQIESLAHKLKSGAVYCGTSRLKQACQYLERYRKTGYEKDLERLYHQLMSVAEQTVISVKSWLHHQ
ncbi:ATP-binding protein [Legionella hackeliae]|uniref:histidine kinase n=1 Tax=Legionella hackeliae TaxID=449 RepID=A0A0A8UWK0_LEGHA|nr:ATP-binding protein [Legionella hackeliae]KTD09584.1 sensory box histidine kinase/response regulator [Legionella hackeliae]CEK11099.1 putative sensory box histidine kinase/response regulator [Legionella hackeliae]